jgi:hypothetical protein
MDGSDDEVPNVCRMIPCKETIAEAARMETIHLWWRLSHLPQHAETEHVGFFSLNGFKTEQ